MEGNYRNTFKKELGREKEELKNDLEKWEKEKKL
jgi:hypothetical protein